MNAQPNPPRPDKPQETVLVLASHELAKGLELIGRVPSDQLAQVVRSIESQWPMTPSPRNQRMLRILRLARDLNRELADTVNVLAPGGN